MRLFWFRFVILFIIAGIIFPSAYAQKEISDSSEMSQEGRNAQTDELFFAAVKAKMHNDDTESRKLFAQFAEKRPEVSDADYELAKYYFKRKNKEKAEEYIKKAIALDSGNKWYREEFATILADKSDFSGAGAIMGNLSSKYPEERSYPLVAAGYFERAGKYEDAISYLDRAIAQVGSDDDLVLRKAQLLLNLKKTEKAEEVVAQLIIKYPKNGKNYKLLGELYDNDKKADKAAEILEKGLKIIPDDPYIQLGLADHYLKAGDSASFTLYVKKVVLNKDLDAETQLDFLKTYIQGLPNDPAVIRAQALPIVTQLVAQHQDDAEILDFYGVIFEIINKPDSAIRVFKQALAIKPSEFETWKRLLELNTDAQHADSLLKYSDRALHLFPNAGILHYYNGVAHFNKKEYATAVKSINRAIDMVSDSDKVMLSGFYSFLGDIYHANKQDDLSDNAYNKALELEPEDATVLNNYSYYLSERGIKLDQAEKMSKKALDLRPGEATFLDTYGWILYRKGEFEKAKEYIQKAIQLAGARADATLYDHLGNVYYKLNDHEKAIENWKNAKEKGGDDPTIDKKISEGKLYE